MTLVIDASVIIKWLLQDPAREAGTGKAIRLMQSIARGAHSVLQPPHWLAEVAAVLTRESPGTAAEDATLLSAMELPVADDPVILSRSCELAIELKQHVFDAYYHAVALETEDAVLITADESYLRVARKKGRIVHLSDWQ